MRELAVDANLPFEMTEVVDIRFSFYNYAMLSLLS